MKEFFKVVAAVILVVGTIVGLRFLGFGLYQYFAPKEVAVQNQVFHESQAYNDGMVRDLENLQMQYNLSTPDQKLALKATILHRFAGYSAEKLPYDLRKFYDELKTN